MSGRARSFGPCTASSQGELFPSSLQEKAVVTQEKVKQTLLFLCSGVRGGLFCAFGAAPVPTGGFTCRADIPGTFPAQGKGSYCLAAGLRGHGGEVSFLGEVNAPPARAEGFLVGGEVFCRAGPYTFISPWPLGPPRGESCFRGVSVWGHLVGSEPTWVTGVGAERPGGGVLRGRSCTLMCPQSPRVRVCVLLSGAAA